MNRKKMFGHSDFCSRPVFTYLRKTTTNKGIWQHAIGMEPDKKMGYSIDDVARGLIVVNEASRLFPEEKTQANDLSFEKLSGIYLDFISANQIQNGRFHNFTDQNGSPIDDEGSPDSFGRTIWAVCHTLENGITPALKLKAKKILDKAMPNLKVMDFIRSNSFMLLGFCTLSSEEKNNYKTMAMSMAENILDRYKKSSSSGWEWFESDVRYSNGAIPLALLRYYSGYAGSREILNVSLASLDFLLKISRHGNYPSPVGNRGWYEQGKKPALYDQQPVDAAAMVLASLEAFSATKDEKYKIAAEEWLSWYEGNNILGKSLLETDGAVHDGINEGWINPNCGAESVVTHILARLRWIEIIC